MLALVFYPSARKLFIRRAAVGDSHVRGEISDRFGLCLQELSFLLLGRPRCRDAQS